ncbi:MAG TPA: LytTR family DNA-binding domain-containing protein [Vicinamibacterales bacterium]|nr:LytTR family DNA-binding domain-containing protein [Vicinamibacterales bacterium]
MTVAPRKIRALIVDDEPLARERMRTLLGVESDVDVVGEASNGLEAVDAILDRSPDLVFLDVHMPKLDGFEVIETVGADRMPAVVFVTAYDQHALRAFEVQALDYLVKPFDGDRFQGTLRRVRRQMESVETGDLSRKLLALVRDLRSDRPAKTDRLVIKSGGRLFFLRTDEIDWIEAAGNYVRLHVGADGHLLRETMTAIEGRLNPETFFRIHRSHIVNIERIKELQPWFNGEYVVILRNGTKLTLSRGYRDRLQERLGKPL